jgi:haloalkane dehalogenase
MNFVTTPESRFKHLPNYQFKANYFEVDGMKMHYVDEGNDENNDQQKIVLMLHGEPSWSYLYRHMIPVCVAAGHRVIAPDLIGFGKSDKPTAMQDYSYAKHMEWMTAFIEQLDLKNMILVCQDWGSLIGLRLAAENEQRFNAIAIGTYSPWFPIARIVDSGCFKKLSKDERRAYDAPFPNAKYKAGTRAFPRLVPVDPNNPASDANRAAWKILEQWQKPFLTCFSNGDPVTRGGDKFMQSKIPGAKGQPHVTLTGGHFLQEDSGAEFALAVNSLINRL